MCVCIPFIERDKSGLETFLMPPCLALLQLQLKSIHPFISASHSASLSFLCSAQHAMLTSSFFFLHSLLLCLSLFLHQFMLHYSRLDLLALDKHHLSQQTDVCTSNSNRKVRLGLKNGIPYGRERSRCVHVCVCWGMCCARYVMIASTFPCLPVLTSDIKTITKPL